MKTIPAGEVKVGMQLVGVDGTLLRVTCMREKGEKVWIGCVTKMSEPSFWFPKTQLIQVTD